MALFFLRKTLQNFVDRTLFKKTGFCQQICLFRSDSAITEISNRNKLITSSPLDPFFDPKVPAYARIGPHRFEIYSIFYGTLLGDGYGELHGYGARIHFHQSHIHGAYLYWLHERVLQYGYVNSVKPKLIQNLGSQGKVYSSLKFRTWTFTSLVPLVDDWYSPANSPSEKRRKILPYNREEFYTPLSLALTIMDDGHFTGYGIQIATDCFTEKEVNRLADFFYNKFNLKVTIGLTKVHSQRNTNPLGEQKLSWRLYLTKTSMNTVRELVSPYICPSMRSKRNTMSFKGKV